MDIVWRTYELNFKHPFGLSHSSRNSTPAIFVKIESNGIIGFGEASFPPYLNENINSAASFFKIAESFIRKTPNPDISNEWFEKLNALSTGDVAAKSAIDIAMHDLYAKAHNIPLYKLWNAPLIAEVSTTFTIAIGDMNSLEHKIKEAHPYKTLKVKLGTANDLEIIENIRKLTNKPITADANQGWNSVEQAIAFMEDFKKRNVVLIEQPLSKERISEHAILSRKNILPVIADESIQGLKDLKEFAYAFNGINIKLNKAGGLNQAVKMIEFAKEHGLKIFLGCMSESSCAISAAAHLSAYANWVDLDGPLLINNDPFEGLQYENGFVKLRNEAGSGASLVTKTFFEEME